MDAELAVAFFLDLVDFVSSSLSSLSDLAAAQGTDVKNFDCIFFFFCRSSHYALTSVH